MIDVKVFWWRVRFAAYLARAVRCGWLCAWRFAWDASKAGEIEPGQHPRDAAIDELREMGQ